jgi:hypothetical protein
MIRSMVDTGRTLVWFPAGSVGDAVRSLDPRGHKRNCSDPLKLSPADLVPQWERKDEVTVTRIPGLMIGGTPTRG